MTVMGTTREDACSCVQWSHRRMFQERLEIQEHLEFQSYQILRYADEILVYLFHLLLLFCICVTEVS